MSGYNTVNRQTGRTVKRRLFNWSTPDPVRIGFYQVFKLYALHIWVTTWLSQGQEAQGQQVTGAIALEYVDQVYHLEEEKDDDYEIMPLYTSWKLYHVQNTQSLSYMVVHHMKLLLETPQISQSGLNIF